MKIKYFANKSNQTMKEKKNKVFSCLLFLNSNDHSSDDFKWIKMMKIKYFPNESEQVCFVQNWFPAIAEHVFFIRNITLVFVSFFFFHISHTGNNFIVVQNVKTFVQSLTSQPLCYFWWHYVFSIQYIIAQLGNFVEHFQFLQVYQH